MTERRDDRGGGRDETGHELTELRALEDALRDLPTEARVPDRLWAGIRERMAPADPSVVPLRASGSRGGRRVSLTLGQLLAASVALAFLSGSAVWVAMGAGAGGTPSAPSALGEVATLVSASGEGVVPAYTLEEYGNAVAELEMVLEEGRQVLGHETIETIEESLATIDAAIDEAADALAKDPRSEVLNRLLAWNMWKKIQILRQTAVAIRARST